MASRWKIGDLARRTQLSVRTLHHYDQIGLLSPSERSEGGHRLYTEADIAHLQRILSLRALGFSLDEIRRCLERPEYALAPLIALHIRRVRERIAGEERLLRRLGELDEQLRGTIGIPVTHLLETMEAITMLDKYLTPEQIRNLETSREGDPTRARWRAFLDELRGHMRAGDDPTGEAVQALAERWRTESTATVDHDAALGQGLQRMLAAEPAVRERAGLDDALWGYLQRAFKP